jgi:hypothetical protein
MGYDLIQWDNSQDVIYSNRKKGIRKITLCLAVQGQLNLKTKIHHSTGNQRNHSASQHKTNIQIQNANYNSEMGHLPVSNPQDSD